MKKKIMISFILIIIVLLATVIVSNNYSGSIITPPTSISLNNGKVYWLTTMSVDSAAETLTHNYRIGDNVKDYSLANGDTVKPQKNLAVTFSVGANKCEYTLQSNSYTGFITDVDGFIIVSQARNITYNVTVDKTKESKLFNAFTFTSYAFKDKDGDGEVVIRSLGSLQGMYDCPDASDVFICADANNQIHYYDRRIMASSHPFFLWPNIDNCKEMSNDGYEYTTFITNFKSIQYTKDSTHFSGTMSDNALGTALISIAADQGMFDSVVYTPPKVVKPVVDSINIGNLVAGEIGTMNVKITNSQVDTTGMITITPSGQTVAISPLQQQTALTSSIDAYFIISTTLNARTSEEICVNVCANGNQFETGTCDKKCKVVSIAAKDGGEKSCGNKVCEPKLGETYTTCAVDCPQIVDCSLIANSIYDEVYKNCQCKDGYYLSYEKDKYQCLSENNNMILYILVGVVAFLLLIIVIVLVMKKSNSGGF